MNDFINVSHAKKLRFLRKSFDKKQMDVATILSISQQSYSDLEMEKQIFRMR
jgi:DNA-binding XRE family transcriptional regulator